MEYQDAVKDLHEMLAAAKKYSDREILESFIKKEKLRRLENDNTN